VVDCGRGARGGRVAVRLLRARFGVGWGGRLWAGGEGWTGRDPLTACAVRCGVWVVDCGLGAGVDWSGSAYCVRGSVWAGVVDCGLGAGVDWSRSAYCVRGSVGIEWWWRAGSDVRVIFSIARRLGRGGSSCFRCRGFLWGRRRRGFRSRCRLSESCLRDGCRGVRLRFAWRVRS